jgi:hypothetical protein
MGRMVSNETLNRAKIKGFFLASCALGLSFISSPAKAQQTSEPEIYVQSATSDDDTIVGPQLIYLIKQDIQNSGRYLLSTDPNLNEYSIVLITLDDCATAGADCSIAYSATLIFHFADSKIIDWYLTSRVGTCGQEVVSNCAQTVTASFVNFIDNFRPPAN